MRHAPASSQAAGAGRGCGETGPCLEALLRGARGLLSSASFVQRGLAALQLGREALRLRGLPLLRRLVLVLRLQAASALPVKRHLCGAERRGLPSRCVMMQSPPGPLHAV